MGNKGTTMDRKVYIEAVKVFKSLYKNKPLNEKVIRTIMRRIESKKSKSSVTSMSESIDAFLNRGSKINAVKFLKEFEVADDYDPSANGVPDFEDQAVDIPFESTNDKNADYTDNEKTPDASNPDVTTDASTNLIAERRRRAKEAKRRTESKRFVRKEACVRREAEEFDADGNPLTEDGDMGVEGLINGNYITPASVEIQEIDDAIDAMNDIMENDEDISFDTPIIEADEVDEYGNPLTEDGDVDEFGNPIVEADDLAIDANAELNLLPEEEFEDYIITEEDYDAPLFIEEDEEVIDAGTNAIVAETRRRNEAKKKKAEAEDKDDEKDDADVEGDDKIEEGAEPDSNGNYPFSPDYIKPEDEKDAKKDKKDDDKKDEKKKDEKKK